MLEKCEKNNLVIYGILTPEATFLNLLSYYFSGIILTPDGFLCIWRIGEIVLVAHATSSVCGFNQET